MREKVEEGVFEKGEREAWRRKSVKVLLRGMSEREVFTGRGDDESRHGQVVGG